MKTSLLAFVCATLVASMPCVASDHADPLMLNMLRPPENAGGHTADLFVFLDSDANPVLPEPGALVIILSVHPAIPPLGEGGEHHDLELDPYTYRVSIDLNAKLAYNDEADLRRQGATFLAPGDIAADATLEFRLHNDGSLADSKFTGLEKRAMGDVKIASGIFDDPFIFPRFFRRNVVAIVAEIPLACFPADQREFLVWGTALEGRRPIDHVGRSQRTQLPRFDYLNGLPPSEHVAAVKNHSAHPPLLLDIMRTAIPPLFGERPYDAEPDVLVFTRDRPTGFPNGRKLSDDVAALLLVTGDAQLWETAHTDDPRFPRATQNDGDFVPALGGAGMTEVSRKEFRVDFPYLASPWTVEEVEQFPLPFPAPTRPNLATSSWRTLALLVGFPLAALLALLAFAVRSKPVRIALALVAFVAFWNFCGVYAANLPPTDPGAAEQAVGKLTRVGFGMGLLGVLALALAYALGVRRGVRHSASEEPFPAGNQGIDLEDRQYDGSRFSEVRAAVLDRPYYRVWGAENEKRLPIYRQSLDILVRGLWRFWNTYPFLAAARRTVKSRADLRWGADGKGVRRLLHPNGICLAGVWKIDAAPPGTAYTGYFAPGSEGLLIGRYSTGAFSSFGGELRSLALVGKLYPTMDPEHAEPLRPATFFTQEDIAGSVTQSIREAELSNSPNVTPSRRGLRPFGLLFVALTLAKADERNSDRQLYEVAELGKTEGPTSCPRFMRLRVEGDTPPVGGDGVDFRDEILGIMYDRGDPTPRRPLVFSIEVSDEGERSGRLRQRVTGQKWTRIGSITFNEAAASYNGDFVIHFPHPPWRNDRNDPESVARPDLRR